jgi:hypothetical protein
MPDAVVRLTAKAAPCGASPIFDEASYSPIQKLVDEAQFGPFHWPSHYAGPRRGIAQAKRAAADGRTSGAPIEGQPSGTDDGVRLRHNSDAATTVAYISERIDESMGATGDGWRFRYDEFSPEEGYSPIAAVHPWGRLPAYKKQHVFSTHVDDDGAVCSQPIHGPLELVIQAEDGTRVTAQVRTRPRPARAPEVVIICLLCTLMRCCDYSHSQWSHLRFEGHAQ